MTKTALTDFTLPQILKRIETEKDPMTFKEAMLGIIQLYFDGLVEQGDTTVDPELWQEQEETLKATLSGVQSTVSQFYREQEPIFSDVRELVLPYSSRLIKHGLQKGCKQRRLFELEEVVEKFSVSLANALTVEGKKVDLIMPVASGGFELAALTASYLGVSQMFPIRYSWCSRYDTRVLTPIQTTEKYVSQQIKGKNVLVVDDMINTGETAKQVANWLRSFEPARFDFAVVKHLRDALNYKDFYLVSGIPLI